MESGGVFGAEVRASLVRRAHENSEGSRLGFRVSFAVRSIFRSKAVELGGLPASRLAGVTELRKLRSTSPAVAVRLCLVVGIRGWGDLAIY